MEVKLKAQPVHRIGSGSTLFNERRAPGFGPLVGSVVARLSRGPASGTGEGPVEGLVPPGYGPRSMKGVYALTS